MIAIIGSPMARVSTDATARSLRPLAPASSPAAIIVAKLAAARPASLHQVLCFGLTKQDIKRAPCDSGYASVERTHNATLSELPVRFFLRAYQRTCRTSPHYRRAHRKPAVRRRPVGSLAHGL